MSKYRGNYKIKCPCGYAGMSFQYGDNLGCPECENNGFYINRFSDQIKIIPKEDWNSEDIINAWSDDLENENHHSCTSMPINIYNVLKIHIDNKYIIQNIMLDLYKNGLMKD